MRPETTLRRILIAAECSADAEAALRLADLFLAVSPAELGGLLLDEGLWSNIGRFPRQSIVTMEGAMMDAPSGQEVRFLRENDARAFQKSLSTVAKTRSVKWSFERHSGDLSRGILEEARAWDILFLGYRGLHNRPGQVVLLESENTKNDQARHFAYDLARLSNTSVLTVSLKLSTEQSETEQAFRITVNSEQLLLEHLSRINAHSVVIDVSSGPLQTMDQLRRALDAARCPIVVLGAGNRLELREDGE